MAHEILAEELSLPAGYRPEWSAQFDAMKRAGKRMGVVMPSSPFPPGGIVWLMWIPDYNLSATVAIGHFARVGVAAEAGVLMLLYSDHAYMERRAGGWPPWAALALFALRRNLGWGVLPTRFYRGIADGAQLWAGVRACTRAPSPATSCLRPWCSGSRGGTSAGRHHGVHPRPRSRPEPDHDRTPTHRPTSRPAPYPKWLSRQVGFGICGARVVCWQEELMQLRVQLRVVGETEAAAVRRLAASPTVLAGVVQRAWVIRAPRSRRRRRAGSPDSRARAPGRAGCGASTPRAWTARTMRHVVDVRQRMPQR